MKDYEASNKIKSPKWNAFFISDVEMEEYLADGIHIQDKGFLSSFSKERRDDETRRERRSNILIRQRIVSTTNEYSKRNSTPFDKGVVSAIIEPTEGVFGQKVSYVFSKEDSNKSEELLKLVETGEIESGDIVAVYPIKWPAEGVFFVTTKGIGFAVPPAGKEGAMLGLGMLQSLGPIGFGVGMIAGNLLHKHNMSKLQQNLISLARKYSLAVLTQCFQDSQFVPYSMINVLTYMHKAKPTSDSYLSIVYGNSVQMLFEIPREAEAEIIKLLSGDTPPRVSST